MLQELFRIPYLNMPVYGYGLMMVVGFLLALQLAKFLARRSGFDPEIFVNAGLIALGAGVLGARLSHILENWSDFTSGTLWENLKHMADIRSGGLTFYGGLLLATPMCLLYGYLKRVPLRVGMDIIAPCVMVGLALGRVGCFLNGCCYGAECNVPWAVTFPYHSNPYVGQFYEGQLTPNPELLVNGRLLTEDQIKRLNDPAITAAAAAERSLPVHPAQLYSTFTSLLVAAVLVAFYTIPHVPGRVFALMCVLDGFTRFLLEMLRVEPPVVHVGGWGLSLSMVIGAGLVIAGIVMWYIFPMFGREWIYQDLEEGTDRTSKPGAAVPAALA